jgi:hypothetical protein
VLIVKSRGLLNDNARADADPIVKIADILVVHADAAIGHEMSDRVGLVGANRPESSEALGRRRFPGYGQLDKRL